MKQAPIKFRARPAPLTGAADSIASRIPPGRGLASRRLAVLPSGWSGRSGWSGSSGWAGRLGKFGWSGGSGGSADWLVEVFREFVEVAGASLETSWRQKSLLEGMLAVLAGLLGGFRVSFGTFLSGILGVLGRSWGFWGRLGRQPPMW